MSDAVTQYFFLHSSYRKKKTVINGKNGKKSDEYEWTSHYAEKKEFEARFGKERLEQMIKTQERFKQYREPDIPEGYRWLFQKFMDIWSHCGIDFNGNVIYSFDTVLDYEKFSGIVFTYFERRVLLKMGDWAHAALAKLRKD